MNYSKLQLWERFQKYYAEFPSIRLALDPDGKEQALVKISDNLGNTLYIIISKSGGSKETRNGKGMLEAKAASEAQALHFEMHSVATTRDGSALYDVASEDKWIATFPMWDWIGGRTSELSSVGLLPAALEGLEIKLLVTGAKLCDEITCNKVARMNPSALLALALFFVGAARGSKNLVGIPYKDRLELFSRYHQQLIMESLGKARDRAGTIANQGISVFGNNVEMDQHSYNQQIRYETNGVIVAFLEVVSGGHSRSLMVDRNTTMAEYLAGFYFGTREVLSEKRRDPITVTVQEASPSTVCVLIDLFERAVVSFAN